MLWRNCAFTLLAVAGAWTCPGAETVVTVEAETGVMRGVAAANARPGASGAGYVTGFAHDDCEVEVAVTVPAAGSYRLTIRYATHGGDKANPVWVNGAFVAKPFFPATEAFAELAVGRVFLEAGANTIRLGKEWGGLDVDWLRVEPAGAPVPFRLAEEPVNPRASAEARALWRFLRAEAGQRVIAGQHNLDDLPYIARHTGGAAPLLAGFDLLFYSNAWRREQPDGDGVVEQARDWALVQRGLVTLSWHWFSPEGATDKIWNSFYTEKTTFDVTCVLDPQSRGYAQLVDDLDRIAEKLQVLREARVPVLWRPLHEAEGRWFWWGAKGPAACKALYRLMYDRFTRVHGLDNLLWVWTTSDSAHALDWYPGDDCVDIVGADIYPLKNTTGTFLATFDNLRTIFGGRKLVALTETGAIPDAARLVREGADWSWFMAWTGFTSNPAANDPALIARTYRHPRVRVRGDESPLR